MGHITTLRKSSTLQKIYSLFVLAVLGTIFGLVGPSLPTLAQNVARGYLTLDTGLRPGMAVGLSSASSSQKTLVERASSDKADKFVGIATEAQDNLLTIASGEQQIYVNTSGIASAYVSDINGEVKKGDPLAVSPLQGILTKADFSTPIIGAALEDFNASNAETQTVKKNNDSLSAKIVKMRITMDNKTSSAYSTPPESTLQHVGHSVVGRSVGELQVLIALVIAFLVLVAEGSIIYGAVTSAITSIGRNPMAKGIIRGELVRVLFIAVFVLLVGLAAVEAVLRI